MQREQERLLGQFFGGVERQAVGDNAQRDQRDDQQGDQPVKGFSDAAIAGGGIGAGHAGLPIGSNGVWRWRLLTCPLSFIARRAKQENSAHGYCAILCFVAARISPRFVRAVRGDLCRRTCAFAGGALDLWQIRIKGRDMSIAFVFPGQGAQTIGMGKDLAEQYPAAAEVFAEVDEALGEKLSALIWEGDQETLTLTQNAQPALMATSIAAFRALRAEGLALQPNFVAGHSLGEYSALVAAGSLSVSDAAKLLRTRGRAMQEAVPVGIGAMAALLGLDFAAATAVAGEAAGTQICQAANDNDPGQVVVSGHREAVERAIEIAKGKGAKRAVLLPVSAPFHCALMQPAADEMARALAEVDLKDPEVPVVSNVRAQACQSGAEMRALLVEQVTGSVRWRESVSWMAEQGVTEMWEIGAGKALCGMIRRIDRSIATQAIGTPENVKAAVG